MDKRSFEQGMVLWRGRFFNGLLTNVVAYGSDGVNRVAILSGLPRSNIGKTFFALVSPHDPADTQPVQHYVENGVTYDRDSAAGIRYDFTRPGHIATQLSVVTMGDYPENTMQINGEPAETLLLEDEAAKREWVDRLVPPVPIAHRPAKRLEVSLRSPDGTAVL